MPKEEHPPAEIGRLRDEVEALRRTLRAVEVAATRGELRDHLDALVRLNTEPLYRGPTLLEALQATMELAAAVLDSDRASAWFLEAEGTLLRCVDLYEHRVGRHSEGPTLHADDYPVYFSAVLSQRAVDANDAETDPRIAEFAEGYLRPLGIRSLLDAAIRGQGKTLGVICLEQTGASRTWTLDEVSFAAQVADHVSRLLGDQERLRAEEARRESERNYREIFDATSDALFLHDATGRILDVNAPMCVMFGCDRESALRLSLEDLSLGEPPFDQAAAEAHVHRALTEGPQTFEWRSRRTSGALFWSEVSLRASEIGGAARVIASVRDITARKEAEAARAALEAQLHQAMKMEAVGRLAGGIAHDFNNLLTAIGFNIELAELELPPGASCRQGLDDALRACETAAALVRQLLAFSRRQIIEPRLFELDALVREVQKMLARLIGEDVTLELQLDSVQAHVRADPAQLEQVLVNLAVNARDAMPQGGRLALRTEVLDVGAEQAARHPQATPGPHVLLRVEDTGQGMSEEVQAHIFEPFFTTKPIGRGTGLGLSTIFGIVQQAGGFIEVRSAVDEGTTFDLYFPRLAVRQETEATAMPSKAMPAGSETVLVVEDDPQVGSVACALLQRLGYRVLHAKSSEDALGIGRAHQAGIGLLLTDVVLPDLNGRELAAALGPTQPQMKVLFTSGYTEDVVLRHGVSEERYHFLPKPYSLRALASKVREVLDSP